MSPVRCAAGELKKLAGEIAACRICRDRPAGARLPHEPRPVVRLSATARLCVSGQAPGTRVHASGLPFDDRSGERLRDWMGVSRDEFYDLARVAIVPMGFCFPGLDAKGGDLPPRRECRAAWHDRVFAMMPRLEVVLAVGRYAQAYHLGAAQHATLSRTVAAWREFLARPTRPRILPLPHPSWRNVGWLKRNPWFEAEVVPALRSEVRRMLENGS